MPGNKTQEARSKVSHWQAALLDVYFEIPQEYTPEIIPCGPYFPPHCKYSPARNPVLHEDFGNHAYTPPSQSVRQDCDPVLLKPSFIYCCLKAKLKHRQSQVKSFICPWSSELQ